MLSRDGEGYDTALPLASIIEMVRMRDFTRVKTHSTVVPFSHLAWTDDWLAASYQLVHAMNIIPLLVRRPPVSPLRPALAWGKVPN
jgi:hypothetical protein